MAPNRQSVLSQMSPKGAGALIVAILIVVALLVGFPAYRWFFLISLGIGLAVWGILSFWHRSRPISDRDIENKRPLGLD
jgi:hypothetical protein